MTYSDPITSQKYTRPRRFFSPIGVLIGFATGLAIGLFISWYVFPIQQIDVAPWQLNSTDRDRYMVAIALAYAEDGDLNRAVNRLLELRLSGDPIQAVADTACALATSGYVNSTSGLQAVRSMIQLYQPQGRIGCADSLISAGGLATQIVDVVLPTSTFTLTPAASKTATPEAAILATPTSLVLVLPTPQRVTAFEAISVSTSCNAAESGLIQVYVYELNGSTGVPGLPVRVRWSGGESVFFTGLIPERSSAYADFQMQEGQSYVVDMPGRADAVDTSLPAVPCVDPTTGERAITSYRVIFRALS